MATIGNMGGLPIFDNKQEAIVWGKRNNLTGYHTHTINRQIGYMGGSDHAEAIADIANDLPNLLRRSGNGTGESHPCKDPLWISMPAGTSSNLQKVDYCNRCAAQSGASGNPLLGNFTVSIVNGHWNHHQGGINYCGCCSPTIGTTPVDVPFVDEIEDAPPTTPTTPPPPTTDGGY